MIVVRRAARTFYYFFSLLISIRFKSRVSTNQLLLRTVQDLGGVYVKFMQFLCLRTELFDNKTKIMFVKLCDQVPPEELDIHQFLAKELKGKEKQFVNIEEKPFAAGSFSQVYKARLPNDLTVILKVKRRDQYQKLWFDFALLKCIITVLHWIFDIEQVDLHQLVKEFRKTTFEELDYLTEIDHAQYFYEAYKNDRVVVIPQTYSDLSTASLIVQEYIDGIPLTELISCKQDEPEKYCQMNFANNVQMRELIVLIAEELVKQHLVLEKFYGDPHPGNIIVLSDNRFAFIDFGILDQARPDRKGFFSLMKLLSVPIEELNVDETSKQVLELAARPLYKALNTLENVSVENAGTLTSLITAEYAKLIEQQKAILAVSDITQKEDMTKTLMSFTQVGKKFQIQLPAGFFNIMRSTAMFKSYASYLEPDFHFMRSVYRTMAERYEGVKLEETGDKRAYTLEESFEIIFSWLNRIAEVDTSLYFKINSAIDKGKYVS